MTTQFKTELPTPQKIRAVKKQSREKIEETKRIKTALFVVVTLIALIFTGLTSYALIYSITQHRGIAQANISAFSAIVLTDGMLLYWTLIAFRKADSSAQRTTAAIMAVVTVTAIGVFGVGEQMLSDQIVDPLQMRYIVTAFVVAQIVGVSIYELTSYDATLSMRIYKTHMSTAQLIDQAETELAESFADVIQADAVARANFAHRLADQVRNQSLEIPSVVAQVDDETQVDPLATPEIISSNGRRPSPKVTRAP